jgi:hypothetical protein
MAKADKNTLTEMPAVNNAVEPVIAERKLIKKDHIGLIHKASPNMLQIHKSMRRHYENSDEWTIVEESDSTKKK